MHRPPPGPFFGSMPSPDFGGARHARLLDFSFSVVALVGAGAVWLAGSLGAPLPDFVLLTKISLAVLLVSALTGIWLIERSAAFPRHSITRFLQAARNRLANREMHRVVKLPLENPPAAGIGALAEDVRALLGGERLPRPPPVTYTLDQAQKLVSDIFREADGLSEVSSFLAGEEASEQHDLREAGCASNLTQSALSQLTDRVVSLTSAVRYTTAEAQRVVSASVALSEQAFAAQKSVAALDDQSATLEVAVEQVESLLYRAQALSRSAEAGAVVDGEASNTLVAELGSLARLSLSTVGALHAGLAEMKRQADEAARSAAEISARVAAQHDLGLALSHAVTQQGAEVADILRLLDEAQTGFVTLRASVEAVTRHGPARLAKADAVRAAADRLPGHAEPLATVLRLLPDFGPEV